MSSQSLQEPRHPWHVHLSELSDNQPEDHQRKNIAPLVKQLFDFAEQHREL